MEEPFNLTKEGEKNIKKSINKPKQFLKYVFALGVFSFSAFISALSGRNKFEERF